MAACTTRSWNPWAAERSGADEYAPAVPGELADRDFVELGEVCVRQDRFRLAEAPASVAKEQQGLVRASRCECRVVQRRDHEPAPVGARAENREHVVAVPRIEVVG